MAADRQAQPSQVNQMFARIILALTLALFAAPAMAAPANAGCVGTPLLAMTYNIRLDTPADGDDAWPHRRNFLIGQIAVMRPELLGLQEVLQIGRAHV